MRTPQRILTVIAAVAAGGCATSDLPESHYDEVARILEAGLTAPAGGAGGELDAFADAALIARDQLPPGFKRHNSGLVEGKHGDVVHRYFVVCVDGTGFAVEPCGTTTERALVFASWIGPVDTALHEGTLRRGGYWTIADPWRPTAMITGNTWLDYDAGAYQLADDREIMLVMHMDRQVVTGGGMTAAITLRDGTDAPPVDIHGDLELTSRTATITLDGLHTTAVDTSPVLIR